MIEQLNSAIGLKVTWALVPTCLLLVCSGCHSAFGGGMDAFHRADYPQASRQLRQAEQSGVSNADAPRLQLYAGLTHLALGNADLAVERLRRARSKLDADPNYFSLRERARLMSAWRALGRMPGQELQPQVGSFRAAPAQ